MYLDYIGQYSLFAAKMNRDVLAVEPLLDNVLRLHKAATHERTNRHIVVLQNAISNQRHKAQLVEIDSGNIGSMSLLSSQQRHRHQVMKVHEVDAISLNDLVEYLPNNSNKDNLATNVLEKRKAVIKIDIEGAEPLAFESASELFESIEITLVIMEWGSFIHRKDLRVKVDQMKEFLYMRNFLPHEILANTGTRVRLAKKDYLDWPWDVLWFKF